jgi:hypothetical protein
MEEEFYCLLECKYKWRKNFSDCWSVSINGGRIFVIDGVYVQVEENFSVCWSVSTNEGTVVLSDGV